MTSQLTALALVAGAIVLLLHHHRRLHSSPFTMSLARSIVDASPADYWQPGVEVSEASRGGELTAVIAAIEADPDTPPMLTGAERRALDQAMIDSFNIEIRAALNRFSEALEPVRQTLKRWHTDNASLCLCCRDVCDCYDHVRERALPRIIAEAESTVTSLMLQSS